MLIGLWGIWLWASVTEEQVAFQSGDIELRGTLFSPTWRDAAPAIVLVHGSGEVTRKSMVLYAWLFAAKGYAALAYDKRGTGFSEGELHEWREFSFDDLAADAAAAYNFLQSQARIDRNRVGFFGASQGGWVVSLAANQVETPNFIIMVSASVSTVAEDRVFGREAQVRYADFGEIAAQESVVLIQLDHNVTRTGTGYEDYLQFWNSHRNRAWFKEVYGDEMPKPRDSNARQWERSILDFDLLPLLERIDTPVLWIFGDPKFDRFSPVALSLDRVATAEASGACYRIIQIDGVGHTLEPEDGDSLGSLFNVRVPLVLDIYGWLDELTSPNICQN